MSEQEEIPTPWLDHMPEGRPTTMDYEEISTFDILEKQAEKRPEQYSMILPKGAKITFAEFYDRVRRLGSRLQKMGIEKGDKVALMFNNVPHYPIAHFACLGIGATVVQVNPLYTFHELKYIIENSQAKALLTLTLFQEKSNKVMEETDLEFIVYGRIRNYLSGVVNILGKLFGGWISPIFDSSNEKFDAPKKDVPNTYDWMDFVDSPDEFERVPVDVKEDIALYQYTGGTTGFPKGAMLTHFNISCNVQQVRGAFHMIPEGEGSILTVLPMFHSFGLTGCMNYSISLGVPMILNIASPPDFGDIIDWIEKYSITFFPGVPRMFVEINKHPKSKEADFSSLISAISGGAPLPMEVLKEFNATTGAKVVEGYGLSETSPVATVNPLDEPREGSIGLPAPDTLVKIVDIEDDSKTLELGETGEICLKGPQVFKGYYNMPEETDKVKFGDGWFKTGDIGRIDEDGYIYIVDRKKQMILTSGYNVYPREVEEVLYSHPKIEEAAANGIPDDKRGEKVAAWVVLKEGETATEEEIIEHCKEYLAPYKVPRQVTFRDDLPTSMVGKVLRREILIEEGYIDEDAPPGE